MGPYVADGGRGRRSRRRDRPRHGRLDRLVAFLGQFTGAADDVLVRQLKAQITAALEGSDVAKQAITHEIDSTQAREKISDIEHAGDAERAQLIEVLHNSFITPFDREDLFRLSRSIDDVLDNLRDFVREVDLMNVREECYFGDILEAISGALSQLNYAVDKILKDMYQVATQALAAKKGGNHIRQLYQVAVADLLSGEFSMDVLKKRELLVVLTWWGCALARRPTRWPTGR